MVTIYILCCRLNVEVENNNKLYTKTIIDVEHLFFFIFEYSMTVEKYIFFFF